MLELFITPVVGQKMWKPQLLYTLHRVQYSSTCTVCSVQPTAHLSHHLHMNDTANVNNICNLHVVSDVEEIAHHHTTHIPAAVYFMLITSVKIIVCVHSHL